MKSKLLNADTQHTYAIVLDTGDEVIASLCAFAKKEKISAAQFTAIGAFRHCTLGFFDLDKKDYKRIEVPQQTEVLSMLGDISLYRNEPKVHAHVVLGTEDGTARGGHLLEATVRPTLEIILTESPTFLQRKMDEAAGIPLIAV